MAAFGAVDLNYFDRMGKFKDKGVTLSVDKGGSGHIPFKDDQLSVGSEFKAASSGHVALFTLTDEFLKNCNNTKFNINAAFDGGKRIETYSVEVKIRKGTLNRKEIAYEIKEMATDSTGGRRRRLLSPRGSGGGC